MYQFLMTYLANLLYLLSHDSSIFCTLHSLSLNVAQYQYKWFSPQANEKSTNPYNTANFIMSRIIRPSEICRGPRWGLTVNMYISFKELNILAAANNDSAMRFGSYAFQSFLSSCALALFSCISFCTYEIIKDSNCNSCRILKINFNGNSQHERYLQLKHIFKF